MLNPIFVIASLYSETNFGVLLVLDFVILGMLSYFQKLTTHDDAKFEGEGLLLQVNQAELDLARERERQEARKKGQIIKQYLAYKANKIE